jgi:hypothetical protein
MENQESEKDKITSETLTPEASTTRKRKILTDPDRVKTKCRVCLEPGNLENMISHRMPIKNSAGVELYGCFEYIYLCSENCRGVFLLSIIRQNN